MTDYNNINKQTILLNKNIFSKGTDHQKAIIKGVCHCVDVTRKLGGAENVLNNQNIDQIQWKQLISHFDLGDIHDGKYDALFHNYFNKLVIFATSGIFELCLSYNRYFTGKTIQTRDAKLREYMVPFENKSNSLLKKSNLQYAYTWFGHTLPGIGKALGTRHHFYQKLERYINGCHEGKYLNEVLDARYGDIGFGMFVRVSLSKFECINAYIGDNHFKLRNLRSFGGDVNLAHEWNEQEWDRFWILIGTEGWAKLSDFNAVANLHVNYLHHHKR